MQQSQPSPRLQAMLYLAEDLIQHKQYYSIEDKIAIKHILTKYLSAEEMQILFNEYDKAAPTMNKMKNVDSLSKIYRIAARSSS